MAVSIYYQTYASKVQTFKNQTIFDPINISMIAGQSLI